MSGKGVDRREDKFKHVRIFLGLREKLVSLDRAELKTALLFGEGLGKTAVSVQQIGIFW